MRIAEWPNHFACVIHSPHHPKPPAYDVVPGLQFNDIVYVGFEDPQLMLGLLRRRWGSWLGQKLAGSGQGDCQTSGQILQHPSEGICATFLRLPSKLQN